jgi:hypothetical protein
MPGTSTKPSTPSSTGEGTTPLPSPPSRVGSRAWTLMVDLSEKEEHCLRERGREYTDLADEISYEAVYLQKLAKRGEDIEEAEDHAIRRRYSLRMRE